MAMDQVHILLLAFPAQGHINPALQFAKRLLRTGAHVTFVTTVFAHRRMLKSPPIHGLSYAAFSDGYDDGFKLGIDDDHHFRRQLREMGSRLVSELVSNSNSDGCPITCILYNFLFPWAPDVARSLHIPSRLLWIQPATVLAIYYHYFHGFRDLITRSTKDLSSSIQLPSLPVLSVKDLPSFFIDDSSGLYPSSLPIMEELFHELDMECNPGVVANTFDGLESEELRCIDKLEIMGVGPLIPSAFLDAKDESDRNFGGDLFENSKDYVEWLDSKLDSVVVYVSFGSMSDISDHQKDEILKGLLASGHSFFWVVRETKRRAGSDSDRETDFWKKVKAAEESRQGLVVPWCSQVEVLSHPSIGCFVSHCGWNSTSESIAVGVPMVGFPQWSDQPTNIKMVESVWKIGVRANTNDDGVMEGGELRRCLDLVMGGGGEMKRNALKYREMAREAATEGGSSCKNIQAFVEEMLKMVRKP